MLKIDKNMNDTVDYVAFDVDHIRNVEISYYENDHCSIVNLELIIFDKEELDEICRILQKYRYEKN